MKITTLTANPCIDRTLVVVLDAIPPIVLLELFDDVQEKIAKNKKAPARRKAEDDYLLTTTLHEGAIGKARRNQA